MRLRRQAEKQLSTLDIHIGHIHVQVVDLDPTVDKESLRALILSKIPADLIQSALNHQLQNEAQ
jgi:hypothetical protein